MPPLEDETEEGSNSQYNSNQRASTIASLLGGNKGTSRYIAPEILNRLPYGCKVDVYSTTITLWQCLALERPYNDVQHATAKEIKESVAIFGDLPEIARHWPKGIRQVIELGWSRRSSVRPSSTEMRILLEQVIEHPHRKPHL